MERPDNTQTSAVESHLLDEKMFGLAEVFG